VETLPPASSGLVSDLEDGGKIFFRNQGYQVNRPSQTAVQGVYCIYTSTATCLGLHWPSSGGTHNIIYKEVFILTADPLSVVQIVLCTLFDKCCRRLFISSETLCCLT
jgi:hypothetical protein